MFRSRCGRARMTSRYMSGTHKVESLCGCLQATQTGCGGMPFDRSLRKHIPTHMPIHMPTHLSIHISLHRCGACVASKANSGRAQMTRPCVFFLATRHSKDENTCLERPFSRLTSYRHHANTIALKGMRMYPQVRIWSRIEQDEPCVGLLQGATRV